MKKKRERSFENSIRWKQFERNVDFLFFWRRFGMMGYMRGALIAVFAVQCLAQEDVMDVGM